MFVSSVLGPQFQVPQLIKLHQLLIDIIFLVNSHFAIQLILAFVFSIDHIILEFTIGKIYNLLQLYGDNGVFKKNMPYLINIVILYLWRMFHIVQLCVVVTARNGMTTEVCSM